MVFLLALILFSNYSVTLRIVCYTKIIASITTRFRFHLVLLFRNNIKINYLWLLY